MERCNDDFETDKTKNSSCSSIDKTRFSLISFRAANEVNISRPSFTKSVFDLHASVGKKNLTKKEWIKSKLKQYFKCSCYGILNKFFSFFPLFIMLKTYGKHDFFKDVISGLTVGIMHIPQGMAYGLLANLPPIYGLYTSFFPVLIYSIFGTSRHISIGTFAVVSIMLGTAIGKGNCEQYEKNETSDNTTQVSASEDDVLNCKVEIAVTTTFAVGIILLLFAIFKLGVVCEYLPNSITRSLTCGAAFHIFTSQVRHIFGYSLGNSVGFLKLIRRYEIFFTNLHKINWASVVLAVICIILIYLVQRFINPKMKEKFKMPLPIDFFLLIVCTGISYGFKFNDPKVFNMDVVGKIPNGFPSPKPPAFNKLGNYFGDAIAMAVVSFIVSYSLGKLFSEMEKYQIDSNQELYAYAFMNLFGSFFNAYVGSASLSRSYVQFMAGGRTQITGLVSCLVLLVVIMAVGPLFYNLPKCVLAAIIVVNLRNIFLQVLDLKYHFKVSIYDGFIFLVTVVAIVLTDVDIGLGIGLGFTFFSVVLRLQRPKIEELGSVPDTEFYVGLKNHANAVEVEKIKIVRMNNSLIYVNQNYFLSQLEIIKMLNRNDLREENDGIICCKKTKDNYEKRDNLPFDQLILDCSHISFIDADGINAFNKLFSQYDEFGIHVSLASCTDLVYKMLTKAIELKKLKEVMIFVSVHDAVTYINRERKNTKVVEIEV